MDSAESLHFVLAVDLSGADAADGFHGGLRQVEAAVAVVGAAVVDAHGHGFAVRGVRDLDLRTERQALVRGSELVRVEGLSVGGLPAVESVPAAVVGHRATARLAGRFAGLRRLVVLVGCGASRCRLVAAGGPALVGRLRGFALLRRLGLRAGGLYLRLDRDLLRVLLGLLLRLGQELIGSLRRFGGGHGGCFGGCFGDDLSARSGVLRGHARLEATTAAVAAVGTTNAESTGRVRTAASTPPAVFARSGECRPDLFFAVSAEKREPLAFVLGAECLPTVMFLVVVTQCPVNSEPEGKDSTQHGRREDAPSYRIVIRGQSN